MARAQGAARVVLAVPVCSPEAARALRAFWADRYARSAVVVRRAIDRGDLPAGTDGHRLLVAATAPLFHRTVLLGEPVDRRTGRRAARDAAVAARAGAFS